MRAHHIHLATAADWDREPVPALDSPQTLVVVFGPSRLLEQPEAIEPLLAAFPQALITGCSTAGEIAQNAVGEEGWAIGIMQFAHTRLSIASAPVTMAAHSRQAGEALARALAASDLKAVFVLSDGLLVNGTQLIEGINAVLDPSVVVTGGLAGDGARFQRTWVLKDRQPVSGCISAVGFYGDRLRVTHGSRGGWDLFGVERRVTRAAGPVLFELDGRPALDLYKEYLGDRAAGLPATGLLFPLAIQSETEKNSALVRTILAVDEAQQSMTFAGDIPEGGRVRLMRANFDRLIDGAAQAADHACPATGQIDGLMAIAISCVGRRLVLGERTEEEVEAVLEAFPRGTRQIGFYSYGELSPYIHGRCELHNQTMTLTTFSEV